MVNSRKPTLKPPAIDRRAVGRRLRELRGFDVNQRTLARELGISQAQLSRYEKGKSEMGAEVVLRISRKFGKSMDWVLTGEGR
jgi:transcriptional regulator with XRE-family HTH domain